MRYGWCSLWKAQHCLKKDDKKMEHLIIFEFFSFCSLAYLDLFHQFVLFPCARIMQCFVLHQHTYKHILVRKRKPYDTIYSLCLLFMCACDWTMRFVRFRSLSVDLFIKRKKTIFYRIILYWCKQNYTNRISYVICLNMGFVLPQWTLYTKWKAARIAWQTIIDWP